MGETLAWTQHISRSGDSHPLQMPRGWCQIQVAPRGLKSPHRIRPGVPPGPTESALGLSWEQGGQALASKAPS